MYAFIKGAVCPSRFMVVLSCRLAALACVAATVSFKTSTPDLFLYQKCTDAVCFCGGIPPAGIYMVLGSISVFVPSLKPLSPFTSLSSSSGWIFQQEDLFSSFQFRRFIHGHHGCRFSDFDLKPVIKISEILITGWKSKSEKGGIIMEGIDWFDRKESLWNHWLNYLMIEIKCRCWRIFKHCHWFRLWDSSQSAVCWTVDLFCPPFLYYSALWIQGVFRAC